MPTAVDFPTHGNDPPMVFTYPTAPNTTQYGDDLWNACGEPAGWIPEVVTQPTHGTVAFATNGQSWSFSTPPTAEGQNVFDTFTYHLKHTVTGEVSNIATVTVEVSRSL